MTVEVGLHSTGRNAYSVDFFCFSIHCFCSSNEIKDWLI